jgi:hypothetical protein
MAVFFSHVVPLHLPIATTKVCNIPNQISFFHFLSFKFRAPCLTPALPWLQSKAATFIYNMTTRPFETMDFFSSLTFEKYATRKKYESSERTK